MTCSIYANTENYHNKCQIQQKTIHQYIKFSFWSSTECNYLQHNLTYKYQWHTTNVRM